VKVFDYAIVKKKGLEISFTLKKFCRGAQVNKIFESYLTAIRFLKNKCRLSSERNFCKARRQPHFE
jgi:hypothetical protein